jgi:hypothetical protein
MVVHNVEIISFTGIVAKTDVGYYNILYAVVLDEGTERKLGGKGRQYFKTSNVGSELFIAISKFDPVEFIKPAQLPGRR